MDPNILLASEEISPLVLLLVNVVKKQEILCRKVVKMSRRLFQRNGKGDLHLDVIFAELAE